MGDNKISLNMQVFSRVRPPISSKDTRKENESISYPNEESICLLGKVYSFNKVFPPESSQNDIYNGTAKSIIKDVLNGYNATVFAYGPTSSGKTFTMEGNLKNKDEMGIMPRVGYDIFYQISSSENKYETKMSFIEIYLEKIRDLLDETNEKSLSVYESKNTPPYISGVREVIIKSFDEFLAQLEKGCSNRVVSATDINERSSRSHSIMQIVIQQENPNTQQKLSGKLLLVDLAGSEVLSNANSTILKESKYINKSLSTLAHVIFELSKKSKHIPYRDSILTRLLKESLGGNAKSIIIICVSPSSLTQTKCSLEFGSRAKVVRNSVFVNKKTENNKWKALFEKASSSLQSLQRYVQELENEILKRRMGEEVPKEEWVLLPDAKESSFSFRNTSDNSLLSSFNQSYASVAENSDEVISLKNQVDSLERQLADLQNEQISILAEQENTWIKCIEKERYTAEQKCRVLTQNLNSITRENDSNVAVIERYKTLNSILEEKLKLLAEQENSKIKIIRKEKHEIQLTNEKLTESLKVLNKEMDKKVTENQSLRSLNKQSEEKLKLLTQQESSKIKLIQEEKHEIQLTNEKLTESFRMLNKEIDEKETEIQSLRSLIERNDEKLKKAVLLAEQESTKIKLIQEEKREIQLTNEKLTESLKMLNKEKDEKVTEIQSLRSLNKQSEEKLACLKRMFACKENNYGQKQKSHENSINELKSSEEKNTELSAEIQHQSKVRLEHENSLQLCLSQLESERQIISDKEKEIEKLRKEKNEITSRLKEELDELKLETKKYKKEMESKLSNCEKNLNSRLYQEQIYGDLNRTLFQNYIINLKKKLQSAEERNRELFSEIQCHRRA